MFLCSRSPPSSASLPAGPPPHISPDDAEQQAAYLLACSGSTAPAPLPPINMYDLLEALQVRSAAFWDFHNIKNEYILFYTALLKILIRKVTESETRP